MTEPESPKRRPWVLFAMLATTIVMLAAGNLIQLVLINPAAQDNKSDISRLDKDQTHVVCALARQTAHFYRNRVVAPNGGLESVEHFRQRMLDQRRVLRLARGLSCPAAGEGFRRSIRFALEEITSALKRTAPPPPEKRQVQQSKGEGAAIDDPSLAAGTSPSASAGGGHRQYHASPQDDPGGGKPPSGGGGGGGHEGGGGAPAGETAPAPAPEPEPAPPEAERDPPPPREEPKPDPPPANGERGVSLCVENPLLPVCVGVKSNAVELE